MLPAVLLKPFLAWRMLVREVQSVETALGESLAAERAREAWLVSRDVTTLNAAQVRASAIDSLAENLNDSVVAPIFWFLLLGLPGARSTVSPTRPTPCGVTAAAGNGRASGLPVWMTRCLGCRRLTAVLLAVAQQRLAYGGDGPGPGRAPEQAWPLRVERGCTHAAGGRYGAGLEAGGVGLVVLLLRALLAWVWAVTEVGV